MTAQLKYNLDITRTGVQANIDAYQGDTASRAITFTLSNGTQRFDCPDDMIAVLYALKPDGTKIMNRCEIKDGGIYVILTTQFTKMAGTVRCQIVLYSGTETIAAPEFNLLVRASGAFPIYEVLTECPDDWSDNYGVYYTKNDGGVYRNIEGESAPEWASGKYYRLSNPSAESENEYGALITALRQAEEALGHAISAEAASEVLRNATKGEKNRLIISDGDGSLSFSEWSTDKLDALKNEDYQKLFLGFSDRPESFDERKIISLRPVEDEYAVDIIEFSAPVNQVVYGPVRKFDHYDGEYLSPVYGSEEYYIDTDPETVDPTVDPLTEPIHIYRFIPLDGEIYERVLCHTTYVNFPTTASNLWDGYSALRNYESHEFLYSEKYLTTTVYDPAQNKTAGDALLKIDRKINDLENQLADFTCEHAKISVFSINHTVLEKGVQKDILISVQTDKTVSSIVLLKNNVAMHEVVNDSHLEAVGNGISSDTTFKVIATDERGHKITESKSLYFYNGVYTGVGNDGSNISDLSKTLQGNRNKNFTVTAGDGEYIYYACPTRYGTPVFKVGGFEGGFELVSSGDFTNASGYTEPYQLWRSTNANLGTITVNVT